ncbi:hypothetical protein EHM76_00665 [bacterium]|nr:MAG: hypothetical protein EHM76_00665 [bacterium]
MGIRSFSAQTGMVHDDFTKLSPLQQLDLIGMFSNLVENGYVHKDPHLGNLAWTESGQPVVMDFAHCSKCNGKHAMTTKDKSWALALQLGLLMESANPQKLAKTELFQRFAGIVTQQQKFDFTLDDLPRPPVVKKLSTWAVTQANSLAGKTNPHKNLYEATLLLASYLPLTSSKRLTHPGPDMLLNMQLG